MTQPQHLKCPACGASLARSSRECEYCGAALYSSPGPGEASPNSRPPDQPTEMTKEEWWYQAGRGAVIIGWIFVVITIFAMLGEGIYFDAVFYLIGGIVAIVIGKSLQRRNAP